MDIISNTMIIPDYFGSSTSFRRDSMISKYQFNKAIESSTLIRRSFPALRTLRPQSSFKMRDPAAVLVFVAMLTTFTSAAKPFQLEIFFC